MYKIIFTKNRPENQSGYTVFINGNLIKNKTDFLSHMWEKLNFPYPEYRNWDGYLDWMTDLSWIEAKTISIVILDFEKFLEDDLNAKNDFLSDFENIIFPYWENDAIQVWDGDQSKLKEILVYCVD